MKADKIFKRICSELLTEVTFFTPHYPATERWLQAPLTLRENAEITDDEIQYILRDMLAIIGQTSRILRNNHGIEKEGFKLALVKPVNKIIILPA